MSPERRQVAFCGVDSRLVLAITRRDKSLSTLTSGPEFCTRRYSKFGIAGALSLMIGLVFYGLDGVVELFIGALFTMTISALSFGRALRERLKADDFERTAEDLRPSKGFWLIDLGWPIVAYCAIASAFYWAGSQVDSGAIDAGAGAGGAISGVLLGIPVGCYLGLRRRRSTGDERAV
jgi:hypothetical protein